MTPDPALALHLRIVGVLMALLVVVNLFVPGRFNWREELVSRGNCFHTVMHVLFSLAWIYVTAVCGLALRAIT
jgi:hypothetical protein